MGRRGTRTVLAGGTAMLVAAGAVVASGAANSGQRERERAETPISPSPIACDGRRTATRDPLRDLYVSPGGDGSRPDQERAHGDIRAASLHLSAHSACLELRLREPVPRRLEVALTAEERVYSTTLNVELHDDRAVEVEWIAEGSDAGTHYRRVRASRVGDTIRVRMPRGRLETGQLRLSGRFRWRASTTETFDRGSQWVDDTRDVEVRPRSSARP